MTETSYARSRRAAILGLLLQVATFFALFLLGGFTHSIAAANLAWMAVGGIPILLAIVLVFRQHELAALEKLDLEELRREKAASGGGDAMFDAEGGGGIGFMVAASRLQWMQRWLVPFLSLVGGAYLVGGGIWWWRSMHGRAIGSPDWPAVDHPPVLMLVLSVVMLLQFLYSRFATGLARVPQWQMMRAAGSYMFLQSVCAFALIIALGVQLYSESHGAWEHALSYAFLILMVLVGGETLVNMVLDIYRPRTPGSEPRAAFDSRILGLVAEPTDIAASIADTLNYQFGFKVSQTWFYQLMQRWFIPLLGFGLFVIWLLSSVVIVAPYERAIIERFGRQMNPDAPLQPGIHFIRPWPFEVARKYNTRQLHHVTLGYKSNAIDEEEEARAHTKLLLWTDTKHGGLEEFPFIVVAPPTLQNLTATSQPSGEGDRSVPYYSVRMTVKVQYEIVTGQLARFTQAVDSPHILLRNLAWREVTRFNASSDIDSLLGAKRTQAGEIIRGRINERLKQLNLGLSVVYVGLQDVHPAKTVAEAFRNVIAAEQEKVTSVRRAIVVENETLSKVAGEKGKALRLAAAINGDRESERRLSDAELRLRNANTPVPGSLNEQLNSLTPQFQGQLDARWAREQAENKLDQTREDFELGLGGSSAAVQEAEKTLDEAKQREVAATASLDTALEPLRKSSGGSADLVRAAIDDKAAQVASNFWQRNIEAELPGLLGDAAVAIASAQAKRWERELQAQTELETQLRQLNAYLAAPEVFKARTYLQTLAEGISKSRKYLFTFDSSKYPQVRLRIDANETASPDQMSIREPDQR